MGTTSLSIKNDLTRGTERLKAVGHESNKSRNLPGRGKPEGKKDGKKIGELNLEV